MESCSEPGWASYTSWNPKAEWNALNQRVASAARRVQELNAELNVLRRHRIRNFCRIWSVKRSLSKAETSERLARIDLDSMGIYYRILLGLEG